MAAFDLPSWLEPKEAPWHALVAGAQVGSQIAANRARNQALYAEVQQNQQRQALDERKFLADNEAQTLQNDVVRAKMTNDTEDFATLRAWWPQFSSDADVEVPVLHNPDTALKLSGLVTERNRKKSLVDVARAMSGNDLSTPEGQANYLKSWTPDAVARAGGIESIYRPIEAAERLKAVRDAAQARVDAKKTAPMLNLEEADRLDTEATGLESTDPERAGALRKNAALLRSTITAPTETIESYVDADGKQQFKITRGPAVEKPVKDLSTPTTATASQIQQRLLSAEKGVELGASLMATLTDADVGVRGNVNQIVINEGLAQLIPGLQKGQVTEARTMLGQFKENALKAIASDPRISNADAKRLEKILPTMGAVESVQSAKDKIRVFMDRFREQSRTDAVAAKLAVPNWALTITELREKVSKGEMTEDEAVKILVKYH